MISKDELIDSFFTRHVVDESLVRSELHGIWESGYQEGLRDNEKKINEEGTRQYNKGYANGHDAGKNEAYRELSGWTIEEGKARLKQAYEDGHETGYTWGKTTAWSIAQEIVIDSDRGGYTLKQLGDIFGTDDCVDIISGYSVEEVIDMIDTYNAYKKSAPTNRDKFEEVFGIRPDDKMTVDINCYCIDGVFHRLPLDEPYKEPEHD